MQRFDTRLCDRMVACGGEIILQSHYYLGRDTKQPFGGEWAWLAVSFRLRATPPVSALSLTFQQH
jgi:hypothetical protein